MNEVLDASSILATSTNNEAMRTGGHIFFMEDLTSYLIVGFLSFALGVFGHIIREKITYYFLKRPKVKVSLEGKNGNYSSNKNLQGKYFFCYIPNCTVRLTNNGTKAITLVSVHLDTSIENQKVIGQYDERGTLKNNGISLRLEPDDSKTLNLGFKLIRF